MFEEKSRSLVRITLLLDVIMTTLVFLFSYQTHDVLFGQYPPSFSSHAALLPVILPLSMLSPAYFGAYRSPRTTSVVEYAWAIIRGLVASLPVLLACLFVLKLQHINLAVLITFVILEALALMTVRLGTVAFLSRSPHGGEYFRRILVIGSGNRARRLAATLLRNSEWGVHIVGFLDTDSDRVGKHVFCAPVLGTVDQIGAVLKNYVVDDVILAIPRSMIPGVEHTVRTCEEEGVRFLLMADVFDVRVARMQLLEFSKIPFLTFEPVAQAEWRLLLKRFLDLVLIVTILPFLFPIFALIAVAIKMDSPGPVFFTQTRVGFKKRRFPCFKFRTMVQDAEHMMAQLEHLNEAEGPDFKIAKDPRVTRVGRILRRTSLDELPQLFNVLRGEMSLVGPRPMSLRDVNLFDLSIQRKRFSVKPGLTCLWQVSGRSQLPFSKWLELDLKYIESWSLGLDIRILFRTIPAVLKGTGAV